jgi:hypothetical protein
MANEWNLELDRTTVSTLQDMLSHSHYGVELYKQAYELTRQMPLINNVELIFILIPPLISATIRPLMCL